MLTTLVRDKISPEKAAITESVMSGTGDTLGHFK